MISKDSHLVFSICSPCEEIENTDPVAEVIPEIDERAKQAELLDEIMIGGDSGEEEEYSKEQDVYEQEEVNIGPIKQTF